MIFTDYIIENGLDNYYATSNYQPNHVQMLLSILIDYLHVVNVTLPRQCGKTLLLSTYVEYLNKHTQYSVGMYSPYFDAKIFKKKHPTLIMLNHFESMRGRMLDVVVMDEEKFIVPTFDEIMAYTGCKKIVKVKSSFNQSWFNCDYGNLHKQVDLLFSIVGCL